MPQLKCKENFQDYLITNTTKQKLLFKVIRENRIQPNPWVLGWHPGQYWNLESGPGLEPLAEWHINLKTLFWVICRKFCLKKTTPSKMVTIQRYYTLSTFYRLLCNTTRLRNRTTVFLLPCQLKQGAQQNIIKKEP